MRGHVDKEVNIFNECYKRLSGEIEGFSEDPQKRICHDCFLIHARNLYYFLCEEKKPRYKDSDVNATDFEASLIKLDNIPIKKIDKQLAHITWHRITEDQEDLFPLNQIIYETIINALIEYNKKVPGYPLYFAEMENR